MTIQDLKQRIEENKRPDHLSGHLLALWYDAKGDWDRAHDIVQDMPDKNASWIHAYLHRKEGDIGNADYWYARAGRTRPSIALSDEWDQIAGTLVQNEPDEQV